MLIHKLINALRKEDNRIKEMEELKKMVKKDPRIVKIGGQIDLFLKQLLEPYSDLGVKYEIVESTEEDEGDNEEDSE